MWNVYKSFWAHYFDLKSATSRNDFWVALWWNIIIYLLILGYIMAYKQLEGAIFGIFVFVLYSLSAVIPLLTLFVRRYNDTVVSRYWLIFTLVMPAVLFFVQNPVSQISAAILCVANVIVLLLPSRSK